MTPGQAVCMAIVGLEVTVMGYCAWATIRVYNAVKNKSG